jgi:hypothetical protein
MSNNGKKHSVKTRALHGCGAPLPEANKIGASTPFDFSGRNLTTLRWPVAGGDDAGEDRYLRDTASATGRLISQP